MLKDRRVLIEQEITKVNGEAAVMYLNIVINNGDLHSTEYQEIKEKILSLQIDLNLINQLIHKGHE